ncbi:HU family DNA-binding protein [Paracidovorax valerianellae]|uniref:DNA-binding protein n=1 Tax=Paracidovorax valerianellae TaxID=187868 RepID=A0A1G7CQG0_9BURK|nr:HU family DNA-binding protein [Paracidovorax valerianellae]MDA8446255.1 HU family DNA-binding protein [Paracidovorax valerianellae]SDE41547.1 DNA-binding protein [Paracidovorax valerianellae]
MATAKKTTAPAKKAAPAAKKAAAPVAKKAAAPAKKAAPVKAAPVKKAAAPKAKAPVAAKAAPAALKPLKEVFTKTSLIAHLAQQAGVEPKAAKAVLTALESAILASVHKKGSGEFTLPGLMKIGLQQVPAKKKRFGKDPFTGAERWFPAKPASVKIKTRALKKLKDATV